MVVIRKRAVRIMREDNLLALKPQSFVTTTDSDHELEVYLNVATRLPLEALETAIADRHPPAGLVRHSDRGVQYASGDYVRMLRKHRMIPSMSRPANPYDNASCESFMKTLKREEIYANMYRDLNHLRAHIEEFIDRSSFSKREHEFFPA
jgi:transposase InsO family protein